MPYQFLRMLSLEGMVAETFVDDGHQSVALDVICEIEMAMRLLNVPFFLEFGCGFSVVCNRQKKKPVAHHQLSLAVPRRLVVTYCLPRDT